MAKSYFDMLTQHDGLSAKQFDPLEELRLLRRKLAMRLQAFDADPAMVEAIEIEPVSVADSQHVSFEEVVCQMTSIKETLACATQRTIPQHHTMLQTAERDLPPEVASEESERIGVHLHNVGVLPLLDTLNVSLISLGMVGVIFGMLNLSWGVESNLPFASLAAASGAVIVAVGIAGRKLS